ncbi:MAG TPA: methionyl-tRNA formyltransferase [Planctomycetota bacterium]|nr:methionyl-tRNA formyltransferase [Planctomycetota bacterium]
MRLVFLGSPPFATPVLARVLESRHVVAAVVTRPDRPSGRGLKVDVSPLALLARARSVAVLQPASARDPAFVQAVRALEPEVLLVASYGEILGRDLLEVAPRGALNVHASILPRHRGASPIQAAILAGDAETGVSIQRMVLALDEGDVLLEKRTPIGPRENASELLDRLSALGAEGAVAALDLLEAGKATFTPQDPTRATYARRIQKEQGRIDWTKSSAELVRHVRAMTPWPGARATAPGGKEIVLLDAEAAEIPRSPTPTEPGTILGSERGLLVATGDGALAVFGVKPAGGVRMHGAAWLRGARLQPGARFLP